MNKFFFLASKLLVSCKIRFSFIKDLSTRFKLCFLISSFFNNSLNVIPGLVLIIKRHRMSAIPKFLFSRFDKISFSNILEISKKLLREFFILSSRRYCIVAYLFDAVFKSVIMT